MGSARRGVVAAIIAVAGAICAPIVLIAGGPGVNLPGTQPADGTGDPAFPPFRDLDALGNLVPGTFDQPRVCGGCHSNYRVAGQAMYEPWNAWAGSMMANAGRDPLFWAALDVANQDDAALGNVGVGDFCLRCHAPKAWYEGRSRCTTSYGESFDGSCLQGRMGDVNTDYEGIICAQCHRAYDASNPPPGQLADPSAPYVGNAQLYFTTEERNLLGPYTDAVLTGGHTFTASPFHRQSNFCAQCHEVTNPALNRRDSATGADLGYRMPVERTWSEYSQSRYADLAAPEYQSCQSCHMPQPDLNGDGRIDPGYVCQAQPVLRGPGQPADGPIRTHVFAGASTWMLGVLRGLYGASLNRDLEYANGIEASRKLMQESTVDIALTAPASATAGDVMNLSVRVTNLAGHKFPTGYPEGRRAWVNVAAGEDADGDGALSASEVQFESAAYDASTGVLTEDAQAKIYEAKLGVFNLNGDGQCDTENAAGKAVFHFVRNDCWVQDNRIPPLGFVPNAETAPVAYAYPDNPALPGTLANYDDSAYVAPVPLLATRDLVVEARVYYQSTSKEYVEFLRDESRSTCDPYDAPCNPTQPDDRQNRGEKMHALWEQNGRAAPLELAVARKSVRLIVPPPSACCVLDACSDLDPAACVAAEGTFMPGQTCATSPCAPMGPPPGEASNVRAGAAPLRVTAYDRATGEMSLSFAPACDATDHEIEWGPLSSVSSYGIAGFTCGLGVAGTATLTPGAGNWWFLVAGKTDRAEGSYGRDSYGVERPSHAGTSSCDVPQSLLATCR